MSQKPRILQISTGGTIAMTRDQDGVLSPLKTAEELFDLVPEVSDFAEVNMLNLTENDSANLAPQFWTLLSQTIVNNYDKYEGFVITHGTDTMSYTAAALSFFFHELDKPIVLTGSQIATGMIGSDGKRNLVNSFRVAASDLAEVVVVFGSKIIRGVRARKISAFSLEAFESINEAPLGEIGLTMRISRSRARRRSGRKLLYLPNLEPEVALVTMYPGFSKEFLQAAVDLHKGLVILGYGTGNIPVIPDNYLIEIIKKATRRNIPVIIGTQCVLGATKLSLYRVGKSVQDAKAIPSMDMTPETALVKLMWILGQTNDMNQVSSMMLKSYVGELSNEIEV
ncbi:MAG: asparaginase [Myxococcota bacterium]